MVTRSLWVAALAAACLSSLASATPWFTQDPRTLPQGKWRIEEHVLYSPTDEALVDGDKVPLTTVQDFSSLTLHTRVRYGIRDDVTAFVDIPWVSKDMTTSGGVDMDNSGLGDLLFLAKGKYYDNKQTGQRRAWAVSLKLDTAESHGLPPPLALGTDTTDFTIAHLWEHDTPRINWYAGAGYTFTSDRGDTAVDPGDVAFLNLAAEHHLGKSPWNFVWEVNSRYQGNTPGAAATTGSTAIALSPGVQYSRSAGKGKSLTLEAGVQVPVLTEGNAPGIADYTAYAGGYLVF